MTDYQEENKEGVLSISRCGSLNIFTKYIFIQYLRANWPISIQHKHKLGSEYLKSFE